ncbi:hypothetical protein [Sanguibacter sp. HDW7]|uniref:hypothetical protein n=1 Tax=Sanguibacter sp. HDW7 TaxID=2714931 RepID=UPI001409750B|nr:hypothetical protein [Sanguibacter sp. HDW7]QIK83817.1 hypothetical protein G7063_09410 [Sanguibacter sp. HDW7]
MSDSNLPPYPGATPGPGEQPPAAPGQPGGPAPYGATPPPPAGQQAFGTTPPTDPYAAQQPYGAPQQPYGQQPYGQQPYGGAPQGYAAPANPFDVGPAFSYGWERFKTNAGVFIGGMIAWVAGVGIVFAILSAMLLGSASAAATSDAGGLGLFAAGFGFGFFVLLTLTGVLVLLASAGLTNAALVVTRTGRVSFGDFFKIPNLVQVLLVSLLVGFASGIVSFTGVGPIVVAFFAVFALHFAIDKGMSAIDAIKASINIAKSNVGPVAILVIVAAIVASVGSVVIVGSLITAPIAMLATAFCYRRAIGEQPV